MHAIMCVAFFYQSHFSSYRVGVRLILLLDFYWGVPQAHKRTESREYEIKSTRSEIYGRATCLQLIVAKTSYYIQSLNALYAA